MTSLENTAFLSQCFVKNLEASARALVLQFTSAVTVLAQERAHPLGTGHTEFDLQHAENNVSNNTSLLSVRSLLVRVRDDMQCLLDRLSTENATHFSDDTLEKVIDSDKRTHERDVFTDKQFCDIEGSSEGSFGTVSAARQHATSSETQQKRILSPVKNWLENSSLVQAHDICPIHVSAFCGVSPKAENTPSCSFDLFECAMDQKQELFEIRQRLDVAVRRIELLEAINLSTCSNASASLQRHQRDCNPANLVKIGSDQHSEERRTAVDASLMGSGPRTALAPTGRGGRSCTRAPVEAWQGAAASPCTLAPVGAQGGSAPRGEQCGDAAEGRASVDRFAAAGLRVPGASPVRGPHQLEPIHAGAVGMVRIQPAGVRPKQGAAQEPLGAARRVQLLHRVRAGVRGGDAEGRGGGGAVAQREPRGLRGGQEADRRHQPQGGAPRGAAADPRRSQGAEAGPRGRDAGVLQAEPLVGAARRGREEGAGEGEPPRGVGQARGEPSGRPRAQLEAQELPAQLAKGFQKQRLPTTPLPLLFALPTPTRQ
eukprot:CAMPEP_0177603642 /NCGR_PEP_ID=MMETSP0419_2-20121207/15635_1 /TAXON_ID=582737 /ORGANISM="Tetraselmis sp., Strain GSL018" /LENGTH=541 /DNA_ID=CAMNT_0019097455 /DNA_START=261 /DNA_END=1882 /DNA_ORIENTATION=+